MGVVRKMQKQFELIKVLKRDLPEKAVQGGRIIDVPTVSKVLRTMLTEMGTDGARDVALCVPTALIYGAVVRIPVAQMNDRNVPPALVSRIIPEPAGDLVIAAQSLKRDLLGEERSVLCVRRDVLDGYHTALREAGLVIASIVTEPMIVSALTHSPDAGVVSFLPGAASVTAFGHGWPIDEAVLAGADDAAIIAEARSIEQEAIKRGRSLSSWIVLGSESASKAIASPTISAKRFSVLSEKQSEWLGVFGGFVAGTSAYAFAKPSWRRRRSTQWSLIAFAIVLLVMDFFLVRGRIAALMQSAPKAPSIQTQSSSSLRSSSASSRSSHSASSSQRPSSAKSTSQSSSVKR